MYWQLLFGVWHPWHQMGSTTEVHALGCCGQQQFDFERSTSEYHKKTILLSATEGKSSSWKSQTFSYISLSDPSPIPHADCAPWPQISNQLNNDLCRTWNVFVTRVSTVISQRSRFLAVWKLERVNLRKGRKRLNTSHNLKQETSLTCRGLKETKAKTAHNKTHQQIQEANYTLQIWMGRGRLVWLIVRHHGTPVFEAIQSSHTGWHDPVALPGAIRERSAKFSANFLWRRRAFCGQNTAPVRQKAISVQFRVPVTLFWDIWQTQCVECLWLTGMKQILNQKKVFLPEKLKTEKWVGSRPPRQLHRAVWAASLHARNGAVFQHGSSRFLRREVTKRAPWGRGFQESIARWECRFQGVPEGEQGRSFPWNTISMNVKSKLGLRWPRWLKDLLTTEILLAKSSVLWICEDSNSRR